MDTRGRTGQTPEQTMFQFEQWFKQIDASNDAGEKMQLLKKICDILLDKKSDLLLKVVDRILFFKSSSCDKIRAHVLWFIDNLGAECPNYVPLLFPHLMAYLKDESHHVQKALLDVAPSIYRNIILWSMQMTEQERRLPETTRAWNEFSVFKIAVLKFLYSDVIYVARWALAFTRCVILYQTPCAPNSRIDDDLSIHDIPFVHTILNTKQMEEEASACFDSIFNYYKSSQLVPSNMMACIYSLCTVPVLRPQFSFKCILALEKIHVDLPNDATLCYARSIRKQLKIQLTLLRQQLAFQPFEQRLTSILNDLGVTLCEANDEGFPQPAIEDESNKRKLEPMVEEGETSSKKSKLTPIMPPPAPTITAAERVKIAELERKSELVEATEGKNGSNEMEMDEEDEVEFVAEEEAMDDVSMWTYDRLTPSLAAEIIMATLPDLPSKIPPSFSSMYAPISAAGTTSQIKEVAKLIGAQIKEAGLQLDTSITLRPSKAPRVAPPAPAMELRPRMPNYLKLSNIVKPMSGEVLDHFETDAIHRILGLDKIETEWGTAAERARTKIIIGVATAYGPKIRDIILEYILSDVKRRIDLALAWLYEEYSVLQGFHKLPDILSRENNNGYQSADGKYDFLLSSMAVAIIQKKQMRDRDSLLVRLFLESPMITQSALDILKETCRNEGNLLRLLHQLVLKRPAKQLIYLNIMMDLSLHHKSEIHENAVKLLLDLYSRHDLRNIIEEYASLYLTFLRLNSPPDILFEKGEMTPIEQWTEACIKCCSRLYTGLLAGNDQLIHQLAKVYVDVGPDMKRILILQISEPIKKMGMRSAELLKLLDTFPDGAETLVTRMLRGVTEKEMASIELASKVKEVYESRVPDVRFLIPVLNSLSKDDILNVLPKIVKLHLPVVKEVFTQLIVENNHIKPALTGEELLAALHTIDSSEADVMFIIKATTLCFSMKQIYTPDILAHVIQNLVEIIPLPTLVMRTVMQALSAYPQMLAFTVNMLKRLISKQVWQYNKVWIGFMKCCQRTKPHSYQVLLQLPDEHLQQVLDAYPDLRDEIWRHVMSYDENQRSTISEQTMNSLQGVRVKQEPLSPPRQENY